MTFSNANTRTAVPRPRIRCAIYTRKSTEEGLDQEFNTLDAQREAGEAYIKSQVHEGWECIPDRYDDGGYTGGNMDRPALQRLVADLQAGRVNCVVVYKVDRLSRSLLDFARIMEAFDQHHVAFVSVTQQFNTSTSMGRLVLNVLLSFAQFEREIISERTRDKIAATRRKGKWSGGRPLLGYDVLDKKLLINAPEAERVRAIFYLYLERQALLPVVAELQRRGWTTKQWTTKKGETVGGQPFTKTNLYQLLTNVVYIGQVRYKTEVHLGEHHAIIDQETFQRVRCLLQENGQNGGRNVRHRSDALLGGLLHCRSCNCAMTHTFTSRHNRRYRYYLCTSAQKCGWKSCPSPSVPAAEIERFVVQQIRRVGRSPAILQKTLEQIRRQVQETMDCRQAERDRAQRQLRDDNTELHRLTANGLVSQEGVSRLAEVQERIRLAERRLTEIALEIASLQRKIVDQGEVTNALATFDPVWETLSQREKARVLSLLVRQVDYDGKAGNVAITFRSPEIRNLLEPRTSEEHAV